MRRRDRCGNAAAREDEFFRQGAREPERNERREKEKGRKRRGGKGAICIGQRTVAREAERKGGGWEKRKRRRDRDENRECGQKKRPHSNTTRPCSQSSTFCTRAFLCACARVNVHTRQIHFRAELRPRASSSAVFHPATAREYLKEVRSPTGKR